MASAIEEPKARQADPDASPQTAKQVIRRVKRYGGRRVSAEDKVRIVMEGLRGEQTVTDLIDHFREGRGGHYRLRSR